MNGNYHRENITNGLKIEDHGPSIRGEETPFACIGVVSIMAPFFLRDPTLQMSGGINQMVVESWIDLKPRL